MPPPEGPRGRWVPFRSTTLGTLGAVGVRALATSPWSARGAGNDRRDAARQAPALECDEAPGKTLPRSLHARRAPRSSADIRRLRRGNQRKWIPRGKPRGLHVRRSRTRDQLGRQDVRVSRDSAGQDDYRRHRSGQREHLRPPSSSGSRRRTPHGAAGIDPTAFGARASPTDHASPRALVTRHRAHRRLRA
jgi:hypothetical protein